MRAIALLLLVVAGADAQTAPRSLPFLPPSTAGRFQIIQLSTARADQYLLDSQTGRLWALVVDTKGRTLLQVVPFYDSVVGEMPYPLSDEVVAEYQKNIKKTRDDAIKSQSK